MKLKYVLWLLMMGVLLLTPVMAQDATNLATISYAGITFNYDPALLGAVLPSSVPEVAYTGDMPPGSFYPAHTAFAFIQVQPGEEAMYPSLYGQLRIFKASEVAGFGDPAFPEAISRLNELVAGGSGSDFSAFEIPATDSSVTLPLLPPIAAAQVFRAQAEYLPFEGGAGIRYLTYYSQGVDLITEGQIYYTFQGVTLEQGYYISLMLPIKTNFLPTTVPADFDYNAFISTYQQYLLDTLNQLNTTDGSTLTPALAALDALVQSMVLS